MIPVEKVEYKKKGSMVEYPDTSNLEPGQPLFTEPQPMCGRGIPANPQLNTTAMEATLRAL